MIRGPPSPQKVFHDTEEATGGQRMTRMQAPERDSVSQTAAPAHLRRRTSTRFGLHHMNLSVPPRLPSAESLIALTVADDCGRTNASSLDAVQQADPNLRARVLAAGASGTLASLDVDGEASHL